MDKPFGEKDETRSHEDSHPDDSPPEKGPDDRTVGNGEEAHENGPGGVIDGCSQYIGRYSGVHGGEDVKPEEEGKECQQVIEGVKHEGHGQSPAAIDPTDKEKDDQTDDVQAALEIAEKLEHSALGGEGLIGGEVELVIQDGDDHVGCQGEHDQDFYQGGFLDQGYDLLDFIQGGGAGFHGFGFRLRIGEQQGREANSHPLNRVGGEDADDQIGQHQVVQIDPFCQHRRSEAADDAAQYATRGNERK